MVVFGVFGFGGVRGKNIDDGFDDEANEVERSEDNDEDEKCEF